MKPGSGPSHVPMKSGAEVFVRSLSAGRLFGEFSMMWSTPRTRSVCAILALELAMQLGRYVDDAAPATLGILSREAPQQNSSPREID